MSFTWVLVLWHGTDLTKELNLLNVCSHCKDFSCGLSNIVLIYYNREVCGNTTPLAALYLGSSRQSTVITFASLVQKNTTCEFDSTASIRHRCHKDIKVFVLLNLLDCYYPSKNLHGMRTLGYVFNLHESEIEGTVHTDLCCQI